MTAEQWAGYIACVRRHTERLAGAVVDSWLLFPGHPQPATYEIDVRPGTFDNLLGALPHGVDVVEYESAKTRMVIGPKGEVLRRLEHR